MNHLNFDLQALKQGDKRVFDEIYTYYQKKVFYFAFSYLKTEADAIDLVQEVFVKFWENRQTISVNLGVEALLFSMTKNSIISLLRKRSSEKKYMAYLETISHQYTTDDTQDLASYNLLRSHIVNYIDELPPKSKEVFLLSRQQGLSNKAIAEQLSITEKTVEGHITKALTHLKKRIQPLGFFGLLVAYLSIL
jgi:RNA polymerase sigma-70 factor (ECF subfamily)